MESGKKDTRCHGSRFCHGASGAVKAFQKEFPSFVITFYNDISSTRLGVSEVLGINLSYYCYAVVFISLFLWRASPDM